MRSLSGDGGNVVVWSDEHTTFDGRISARGGAEGGDGGLAEVSGKAALSFSGQVDLSAPAGGRHAAARPVQRVHRGRGPLATALTSDISDDVDPTITFTPTADNSIISAVDIEEALEWADVTIQTSFEGEGDQAGNITVGAPLSWDLGTTLTLEADNDILINAAITAPEGGLTLTSEGGAVGINAPISIDTLSSTAAGTTTISAPIAAPAMRAGPSPSAPDGLHRGGSESRHFGLGDEASLVFSTPGPTSSSARTSPGAPSAM